MAFQDSSENIKTKLLNLSGSSCKSTVQKLGSQATFPLAIKTIETSGNKKSKIGPIALTGMRRNSRSNQPSYHCTVYYPVTTITAI